MTETDGVTEPESGGAGESVNAGSSRSVLILAGGESRRLGQDKASSIVGGWTVLERVLAAVSAADLGPVPDIMVSFRDVEAARVRFAAGSTDAADPTAATDPAATDPPAARDQPDASDPLAGVRLIEDERPGLGPVAGLASGLPAARHDVVGVFTADMPFLSTRLIDALFEEIDRTGADVVLTTVGERLQRLCGVYRREVGELARELIASVPEGEPRGPRVHDLFARLDVHVVDRVEGLEEGALETITRGIDTPTDLEWARDRAGPRDPG